MTRRKSEEPPQNPVMTNRRGRLWAGYKISAQKSVLRLYAGDEQTRGHRGDPRVQSGSLDKTPGNKRRKKPCGIRTCRGVTEAVSGQ